jgi:uncharacterized protein (DUF342 family)
MDEHIVNELDRIKEELAQRRDRLQSVEELVKDPIDRDFAVDLWQLSPRELDAEMGDRLSALNDSIDPRPTRDSITSHRRILGKPVVLVKKLVMRLFQPAIDTMLEKQRQFNEQAVAFHLASFIRLRQNERTIKELEERLAELDHRLLDLADDIQKGTGQ